MPNDLQVIERQLTPLLPRLDAIIPAGSNLAAQRIMQSIMVSCERSPDLMAPERRASLLEAAFSAAALGLTVDGVTGQGYIIAYNDRRRGPIAQFQIGVKGYSTIAGRSKYTLGGDVVYEGEKYDIMLGTNGHARVHFDPEKRNPGAKIIAAFATLESLTAPPLVLAMSLDEIMKVRAASKASSYAGSPWNNWFDQMAIKSAKKRLAKSCPLDVLQMAGALDDAVDMGHSAHIRPEDGALIVDHEAIPVSQMQPPPSEPLNLDDTKFGLYDASGNYHDLATLANWQHQLEKRVLTLQSDEQISEFVKRNAPAFSEIARRHGTAVDDMRLRMAERIDELSKAAR